MVASIANPGAALPSGPGAAPGCTRFQKPSPLRPRGPFQDLLVLLVLDLLRFHQRNHLLTPAQGEGGPAGSRSETEKLTGVLVATVRDPKVKTQRQTGPRAQNPRRATASAATQANFHARATSPRGYQD